MSAIKDNADISDVYDLKSVCDQNVGSIIKKLGYKESFFHQDVILVLGYLGVIFCISDFLLSYKFGFNETKWFSYISVSAYAAVSLISFFYSRIYTKDVVFYGTNGDITIRVTSKVKKHEEYYELRIYASKSGDFTSSGSVVSKKSFGEFFYSHGHLSKSDLDQEISSLISAACKPLKRE
ncbi:hypothetical protein BB560_001446 [Smittium megazygosporum]|uniref:Signal peptidase complex subunit 2 n=1 Tax=Smittium megazygosporum TaxID=133381 RepID=A0A2T9ZHK0_9FUNG|nr:hypothetical protein BB560_001444 [Smittium megazygosporum]PVV04065.1 hypothetical protein BB560_001446 [Smittium megazygosporum]